MYYVYLLKCSDNKTYVGCTKNLRDRISRHESVQVLATRNRSQLQLVCYLAFDDKYSAFNFEKYLKTGSGRAFLKKRLAN